MLATIELLCRQHREPSSNTYPLHIEGALRLTKTLVKQTLKNKMPLLPVSLADAGTLCYNALMNNKKPITILLYENNLPALREIRCVNCARLLCKVNSDVKSIIFEDGYDPHEHRELVADMNMIEHKCRGCDCVYKILFQK